MGFHFLNDTKLFCGSTFQKHKNFLRGFCLLTIRGFFEKIYKETFSEQFILERIFLRQESVGFHFWKYKTFFNIRGGKSHFLKYKEFVAVLSVFSGLGLASMLGRPKIYYTYIPECVHQCYFTPSFSFLWHGSTCHGSSSHSDYMIYLSFNCLKH